MLILASRPSSVRPSIYKNNVYRHACLIICYFKPLTRIGTIISLLCISLEVSLILKGGRWKRKPLAMLACLYNERPPEILGLAVGNATTLI